MHTQDFVPVPAFQSASVPELETRLNRLRLQLALERIVLFAVRGSMASSLALIGLLIGAWLGAPSVLLWLALAPVLAAVLYGLARWPSRLEAARVADRRLMLHERLATAAELLTHQTCGRFDALQIRDTAGQTLPRVPLAFTNRTRLEVLAAFACIVGAIACAVLLPGIPRLNAPAQATAAATDASTDADLVEQTLPTEQSQANVPTRAAAGPSTAVTRASADLASRVQQEQAEGSALDNLARGLSSVSAGQQAANDLQQGNFSGAADELRNLADNADQLSDAAKQQLAQGLQQAASGSRQTDPALARSEQQAAQALTRSTYVDQRQALRSLADQVERSGSRSVSADQLARDVGEAQQQAGQSGQSPGADSADQGQSSTASGQSSGGGQGQQGGPGAGTGTNPNPYSDQPTRLDTSGQRVDVPLKLGQGPGVRPSDGNEDGSVGDPSLGGKSVSQVPEAQQTGQVTPERNLVPDEQRPIVRGYFR